MSETKIPLLDGNSVQLPPQGDAEHKEEEKVQAPPGDDSPSRILSRNDQFLTTAEEVQKQTALLKKLERSKQVRSADMILKLIKARRQLLQTRVQQLTVDHEKKALPQQTNGGSQQQKQPATSSPSQAQQQQQPSRQGVVKTGNMIGKAEQRKDPITAAKAMIGRWGRFVGK